MKTVTYLRISTDGQNLEPQRIELARYAEMRGWIIENEYSDVISGSKASRKGLDRLMADIAKGKVQAVMAVKIDRLARSMSHFSQIVQDFTAANVALIIPGQNIDTSASNPAGRLTMNILASIAEFERELIRDRTKSGLQAARARGVTLGRPTGTGKPLPIAECRALMEGGKSIREASRELGIPLTTMRWGLRREA